MKYTSIGIKMQVFDSKNFNIESKATEFMQISYKNCLLRKKATKHR